MWRGPKRILEALNDHTFEVQDMIEPFAITIRHASRLQLYRDAARGRVEELQEQAIYGEGGHLVEAPLDCRLSPDSHRWEGFVKWFGLDDIEASWEPADIIKQDAPDLFQVFVAHQPEDRSRSTMAAALAAPGRSDERPVQRPPRRRHPRQSRT